MIIRGVEDPIYLLEEEGKAVENLLADSEKNGASILQIEGIWTGRKSDIKALFWEREEKRETIVYEKYLSPEEKQTEQERITGLIEKYKPDFLR